MKRVKYLLTALLLLCGVAVNAQKQEVGGLYYEISGDAAVVTSSPYGNYTGDIVIPETITFMRTLSFANWTSTNKNANSTSQNTYTLHVVAGDALSFDWSVSSEKNYDKLIITLDEEEIINESGEQSGSYEKTFDAAGGHTLVVKYTKDTSENNGSDEGRIYNIAIISSEGVEMTYSVTGIAASAFSSCSSLASIVIPDSVKSIGASAFSGCSSLASIVIPDSVKSIEDYVFSGCSALTSITIPNSVTSIGASAFSGCSALTSITIPNSVASIGASAFSGCSSLASIVIPDSVTSIGASAFSGCSSLASIVIPNSVTSIGALAFSGCSSLASITVASDNTVYDSRNNCNAVIETATNTLLVGCQQTVIPNDVETIAASAFAGCTSLANITIPNSVASIGNAAFDNCTALKELRIEDGEATLSLGYNYYDSSLGEGLFYDCPLETLYLDRDLSYNTGSSYGYSPFYNKTTLTDVVIGDSVTSIGMNAFKGCSNLASIEIPDSVTSIGNSAFSGCSSLASIVIPDSVASIGNSAFYSCSNLKKVVNYSKLSFTKGSSDYGYVAYYANKVINVSEAFVDGDFIWSINDDGNVLDAYLGNATELVLPTDCQGKNYRLGDYAFAGCSSLASIVIPDSVTSIGASAFSGCSSLASIVIPDSVKSIEDYVFSGCSAITSITIPKNVTSVGNAAFDNCTALKKIRIEDGEAELSLGYNSSSLGEGLFYDCPLETLYLGRDLSYNTGSSYGYSPFYNKTTLTDVVIGDSVTKIGMNAFDGCSALVNIDIPNDVRNIGASAFSGCSSLASIVIPDSVKSIGNYVFSSCSALTSMTIPKNVTSVGNAAFDNCTALKELRIEDGEATLSLGYNFYHSSLGEGLFYDCPLETLYLGRDLNYNTNSYYGCSPFYNKTTLTDVVIGDSVTSIGALAFSACSALTSMTIPKNVTRVGNAAFDNCESLKELRIEDGEATLSLGYNYYSSSSYSVGEGLFYDCPLETLYLGRDLNYDTNSSYGYSPFGYKTKLTDIVIGDSVTKIGMNAFKECSNLASIEIPNNVTNIYTDAFSGCTNLKKVKLNTTEVGTWFRGNSFIKEVVLGNSVKTVSSLAFNNCSNLASVTVGSKVASIGVEAFSNCYITKAFWLANTPPYGYEYLDAKINYVSNNEYGYFEGDVVVTQFLSSKFEVDGMEFIPVSFSDKKCCVVSYDVLNEMPDVVINDKISYKGVEMAVEDVMPYSFYRNDSLSVLTLRNSGSIGKSAFEYCDSLKNVEIPATVTAVGDYAFRSCENLEYAVICDRETVLPLGLKLFDNTSIDSLYIGGKISYSQEYSTMSPFNENSTLRTVVIADAEHNIYDYEFYNCNALETVTLGDGIENIGRWAFSGCSALTDFYFGVNLVSIGEEAFSDCVNMRSITGRAVLPPLCGDQALDDIVKWDCTLTVPSMYLNEYKEASQWREFFLVEELVTNDKYITYKVDGEIYKTVLVTPGSRVTLPTIEDREGYTFSWNYDEEYNNNGKFVMPDKDIVVLGEFTGKSYTVTYKVEGEKYLVENVACGSEIVLPEEPMKEGYSFTGWVDMPEVMPAGNIVVEASFAINTYTITYLVDEKEYKVITLEYGAKVPAVATPKKRGYTFTGWNEVLKTMPGEDVVIFGSFVLNNTAIDAVEAELEDAVVYDINGVRVEKITKAGVYIINGVKVLVK